MYPDFPFYSNEVLNPIFGDQDAGISGFQFRGFFHPLAS